MSYYTGTVTATNSGPSIIIASDTVDRMVYLSDNINLGIGFTSGTCTSLLGHPISFVLPAGQDLYGSTSFTSESASVMVTKVIAGPTSFSGTLS